MIFIKSALVVFAREPRVGKVKTRLVGELSEEKVFHLYLAFIKDVLGVAKKVRCDQRLIYYVGRGGYVSFLEQFRNKFILKRQMGKDLGVRMHQAFVYCQKQNFNRIIIVGTDCLTITPKDIEKAFKELDTHDCVLGPSKDGGYYLIGFKEPNQTTFKSIDWSTSRVLKQTLRNFKELNMRVCVLEEYEDVDTFEQLKDVYAQIKHTKIAPYSREILEKLNIS